MEYISTLGMSRDEWIKLRSTYLGASEYGSVLGLNKYSSPLDIYNIKMGEKVIEDNIRMKFGRDSEDLIADWFMEETGLKVRRENKIRIHPDYPFLATNIDRMIVGSNGNGTGSLQIKTASDLAIKAWEGETNLNYYAQIQGELAVTGWTYAYFAILVVGFAGVQELKIIRYDRDNTFIDEIIPELVSFWQNHVQKNVPPEAINENDLKALYPDSEPEKAIEAAKETLTVYRKLVEVKTSIAKLEKQKKQYEQEIKLAMRDAERLTLDGYNLVVWKTGNPTKRFDAKGFKSDHPSLYENYLKESNGSRRFLVKNPQ